ncbi:iron complex transport system permease protein [Lachnospiraceae bacterium C7]|nr:iron complex transport system permease protein [Lachnospiraceae bacterium C7]
MIQNKTSLNKYKRIIIVFTILIALLIFFTILSIFNGTVGLSDKNAIDIIIKIRIPRMLEAMILGGALALSGYLLQTYFMNPIAGPFVLGISSGAKMFVAFTMIFFLKITRSVSSITLILAAFVGALASTAIILLVSKKVNHMASLLVAGIMIGYICSAITDFMVTFAEDEDIVNLHGWSKGSFSGSNYDNVIISAGLVISIFVLILFCSKPIGALQLGEGYAMSMGVDVKKFRLILILLSSLLSACVTAFAGPISFVGIAVPYLIKQSLNTTKPVFTVPGAFLGGGVFCMGCDLVARTVFAPLELNISTVTSIFGAPVVIFMLISRNQKK